MREFQTVSEKRLDKDSFPFRLYNKAKKFGTWDPRDIDFTQDKADWETLSELEKKQTLRSISQFIAGEEAVTLDILPLIMAVAREGRLEEEMFLTTFLFEEAKHTEFFERFLEEVVGRDVDLRYYHTESHRKIFGEELPKAMNRLITDSSPEAMAIASTTYNMVVEGVLAETGYHAFYSGLGKICKMPGLMKGIGLLKTDESRHIAFGTYLLQRLICEHGEHIFQIITERMTELMPYCVGVMTELPKSRKKSEDSAQGGQNKPKEPPFGLNPQEFIDFALKQIQVRLDILKRSSGKSIHELYPVQEVEEAVLV